MEKYYYSEIFKSLQGEGNYSGKSTIWLRLFACNLQCNGFGQKDPTDPSSYELPYKDVDLSIIKTVEDLPVLEYGCDSSYTWSKRFKHLMKHETGEQIAENLRQLLITKDNPRGLFKHPKTNVEFHMAYTGGEPMLPLNQRAIISVTDAFYKQDNLPKMVTIETNGTQHLTEEMERMIAFHYLYKHNHEWFWSVSPKLFSTSGEKATKAIKPNVIKQYCNISNHGQLKFVCNGSPQSWVEIEDAIKQYRQVGCEWDVYIMPVGATKEQQETDQTANIAIEAIERGYHVSGRLHCYIFGNKVGT